MHLSNDLREFLTLLNSRRVEYVIVGAHSLAFHGRPRCAGDLAILIGGSRQNGSKIIKLLHDFGFAESGFTDLSRNKRAVARPQDLADLESL